MSVFCGVNSVTIVLQRKSERHFAQKKHCFGQQCRFFDYV